MRPVVPILYTPAEAARALAVPVREVYRLIKGGLLGVVHVGSTGRRYRVPVAECERYAGSAIRLGSAGRRTRAA